MATRLTTEEFIIKAKGIHGEKYDYSKVNYKNAQTRITIGCPLHGDFQQIPNNHITGNGCLKCKGSKISNTKTKPIEYYLPKFQKVHGDKYDYSLSVNNDSRKIDIICSQHGIFNQWIQHHIKGSGCPTCGFNVSKLELGLQEFVKSLGYEIITNKKDIIKPYELDIYIPSLQKAIEFNGMYWHYYERNPNCKPKAYHAMKSNLCKDKNIRLLHIREDLWRLKKENMKQAIIKFLNT